MLAMVLGHASICITPPNFPAALGIYGSVRRPFSQGGAAAFVLGLDGVPGYQLPCEEGSGSECLSEEEI